MTQSRNGNGNPLGKLRHSVSMPKGSGVGYKQIYLAALEKGERELEECRQDNRLEVRLAFKSLAAKDEMIARLMKRLASLEQENKRLSGNGNGIPGIGFDPEAAAGRKQEEEKHEDDDTHGE